MATTRPSKCDWKSKTSHSQRIRRIMTWMSGNGGTSPPFDTDFARRMLLKEESMFARGR